ncbi:HypC/HybG/HupF family hydrogenase formation chaperone [Collinsella tanakaei]|uniref:HypC/HybG/HupF family hydrogenase formation chaperone n=1 Tax=Collinsella tanakaei TaxID=626935 RepID=UPI0019562044|nr:HypC/HybG/HupF family hydrogenase formation chaperone [Collinsella tanakaei]MBM6756170.1 HypC/HybG/HupF family hydrogenase formation chaperone [Collinsella tanakaei]MBM6867947.1 HypC/HybG/HupF family hydrogenase formation chaperone [Collinsella tanakaei]
MCLAVPGKLLSIEADGSAVVDMLGARREVSLRLVPDAQIGDYVLVHAGFGIQVIDPAEAEETIRIVRELDDLVAEELPLVEGEPA